MTSVLIKGVYYVSKKNRTVKKANQFKKYNNKLQKRRQKRSRTNLKPSNRKHT